MYSYIDEYTFIIFFLSFNYSWITLTGDHGRIILGNQPLLNILFNLFYLYMITLYLSFYSILFYIIYLFSFIFIPFHFILLINDWFIILYILYQSIIDYILYVFIIYKNLNLCIFGWVNINIWIILILIKTHPKM